MLDGLTYWMWLQEVQEEEELRRARERLTLKHRNTSRWARRALKRGLDLATDEQRGAIAEQLRHGQELKAKRPGGQQGHSDADGRCWQPEQLVGFVL
jgi:U3 small nucleolar RNA-associated protein 14